ncbi:MAG: thiamine-phosphate kinase [Candidatus Baldrarchaeia archaeon]
MRMKLSDLGERRIIDKIIKMLRKCPQALLPLGDDAAAYELMDDLVLLIHTDMLVWKTDVPPAMSPYQVGRKLAVMNYSDIAAKGGKPVGILVSFALPSNTDMNTLLEIMRGIEDYSKSVGAYVLGGDLNESNEIIVSGTSIGLARKNEVISRFSAKPGDFVAVTGYFGRTGAGLKILLEGISVDESIKEPLVKSVLEPNARIKEGIALAKSGAVSASIDSSDGLAESLYELSAASDVGFIIFEEKLPIPREVVEFSKITKTDPLEYVFYGGEEYELVLTVRKGMWEIAEREVRSIGGSLFQIGHVIEERKILLKRRDGSIEEIKRKGYQHF